MSIDTLEEILKPWEDEIVSEYGTGINDDKKPQFIAIEQAKQAINLYIEERVKEAEKANLDALYWMYIQYCSGGHDFMGAGETASEILENAGYITVDGAGRIIKDNDDSQERAAGLDK
jgi:hypothetical protein